MSDLASLLNEVQQTIARMKQSAADAQQACLTYEQRLGDLLKQFTSEDTDTTRTIIELERAFQDAVRAQETAEESLEVRQQEANYKIALALTLANAAYDALLVIDTQHRVIAINDRAEALFGRARPINELLVEVTGAPELELMVEDALANEEESYEDQLMIKDRTYRVHAQVIRRDGNFFIALALQDISELVKLNRARRDMVANISHELGTPIANIRLTIDSLFHEQDKPKRKQSISSLRAIARETDALQWIVQELLDLSMIETGQAIMRMVPNTLHDLVETAIERLGDQLETKALRVHNRVPEGISALCDSDQIRRVLVNLIHNAMKWSPHGETITVLAQHDGEEVTVRVHDNGPGVPDDQTERIFERFYQVDTSRSGKDGTGLGLAICRHIIAAHGGRIWAEGANNAPGGRFAFTLLSVGGG